MFRHVGIVVRNIQRELTFYVELLNLEVYYDAIEEGSFLDTILNGKNIGVRIIKLGINNKIVLELLDLHKYTTYCKTLYHDGYTHFAITVKDIESIYDRMKNNAKFLSPPQLSGNGTVKVCFCQDPEGNFIELVEEIFTNEE